MDLVREEKGIAAANAARRFLRFLFQWFLTSLSILLSGYDPIDVSAHMSIVSGGA
jgi:hypothetical protein